MTIKVSQESLNRINETSIAFRDGSGFIAELAVYHELHCIVRLSEALEHDGALTMALEENTSASPSRLLLPQYDSG